MLLMRVPWRQWSARLLAHLVKWEILKLSLNSAISHFISHFISFLVSHLGNGRDPNLNSRSVSDLTTPICIGSGLNLGSTRILRSRIGPERILVPGLVGRIGTGT